MRSSITNMAEKLCYIFWAPEILLICCQRSSRCWSKEMETRTGEMQQHSWCPKSGQSETRQHNDQSGVSCAVLSKKDTAVRRKELLDVVSPALLEYLCTNAHTMVTDKATSVTVSDILASACGDLRPAMTAVAQLANQELVPGGTNDQVSVFQNFLESWKSRKPPKPLFHNVCGGKFSFCHES